MALGTLTRVAAYVEGNRRVRIYDVQVTAGANYTVGGETITPQAVGLGRRIDMAMADGCARTASGDGGPAVAFIYQANGSVKIVGLTSNGAAPAVLDEPAANTNFSTHSVRVKFIGT